MDYVFIASEKKLRGSGLSRGDVLLVTGTRSVPASRRDPYLTRELIVCVRVNEDGEHYIPKQENEYKAYLIDPRNVDKVPDEAQAFLSGKLKEQYGG